MPEGQENLSVYSFYWAHFKRLFASSSFSGDSKTDYLGLNKFSDINKLFRSDVPFETFWFVEMSHHMGVYVFSEVLYICFWTTGNNNSHCYYWLCDCFICLIFVLYPWLVSSFTTYFLCLSVLQDVCCRGGQSSGSTNASLLSRTLDISKDFDSVECSWFCDILVVF